MKPGWKTLAIGRHLIDVPEDATLIQQWRFDNDQLKPMPIQHEADFKRQIAQREAGLRAAKHGKTNGAMFIERVDDAHGGVLLISWKRPGATFLQSYDAYFRDQDKAITHSGEFDPDKKHMLLKLFESMQDWRALSPGRIPTEPGYVAGDMLLVNTNLNRESWSLYIKLANKPDVSLEVRSFVVDTVKPDQTLRKRAGGILVGMLGMAAGLHRLRNRERKIGPIWAEEILVAGTQDGKRGYGFKWEAPGKAESLAEPQLNIALEVSESAYKTNAESFKDDDEALALWDALVESIRLRPGAV